MKKKWILTTALFISVLSKGQDKNQLNEMIISSLNTYIEHTQDLLNKGVIIQEKACDHYYICSDGLPRHFPYDSVKNAVFFSVDFFSIYPNSFKRKLRRGIGAFFIGINLTNNQLRISVSVRSVKLKEKNQINLGLSDWGYYFYEYACEHQKWLLAKIEYGGV